MTSQLSNATILAILAEAEQQRDQRARALPTLDHCLIAMVQIMQRLRELGWRDAEYAPRDRTFLGITPGSTRAVRCVHLGGAEGAFFCEDGDDFWPVRILVWRELTDADRREADKVRGAGCKRRNDSARR